MSAHTLLLVLGAGTAIVALAVMVELAIGGRSLASVRDTAPVAGGPEVSIIVAARDEAPHIEAALSSLLRQRYAGVEVVAIDDRSADATGEILDRMAREWATLRVVHVTALPPGWLGKNHALQRGAEAATGEILIFTDADVVFDPTTVGRVVAFMERDRVDHLTMGPSLDLPTAPLALVVNYFTMWFLLYFKPWLASRHTSAAHMGIGAFNAVRASVYRGFGGHTRIAMRPDDDVKLGKLVKLAGARQVVASGAELIRVKWYGALPELIRGMRKNAFAGLEYRIWMVVGSTIGQLVLNVWPFVALFVTSGVVWWLNLATTVVLCTMYALTARAAGDRPWLAPLYPVAALIFIHIVVASSIRTLRRGGIEWRETFYPLAELRRNRV